MLNPSAEPTKANLAVPLLLRTTNKMRTYPVEKRNGKRRAQEFIIFLIKDVKKVGANKRREGANVKKNSKEPGYNNNAIALTFIGCDFAYGTIRCFPNVLHNKQTLL